MSETRIDPWVMTFHEASVEAIRRSVGSEKLSLRDIQWIRADARAAFLAADRRVVELGGRTMRGEWT